LNTVRGISAREATRTAILKKLLTDPQHFNELAKLGNRGTVNKYLKELYTEGIIEKIDNKNYGTNSRYRIVPSKRKQVLKEIKIQEMYETINDLKKHADTPEEINELIEHLSQPAYDLANIQQDVLFSDGKQKLAFGPNFKN
jgi:predicted transcriptional regulator